MYALVWYFTPYTHMHAPASMFVGCRASGTFVALDGALGTWLKAPEQQVYDHEY